MSNDPHHIVHWRIFYLITGRTIRGEKVHVASPGRSRQFGARRDPASHSGREDCIDSFHLSILVTGYLPATLAPNSSHDSRPYTRGLAVLFK